MSTTMDNNKSSSSSSDRYHRGSIINIGQWKDQDYLLLACMEYLDTVSLIQKQPVCTQWKRLCTQTIDMKCTSSSGQKKTFQSKKDLQHSVRKYCGRYRKEEGVWIRNCSPTETEEIASEYGYPIDKWDVSNITDFSNLFSKLGIFNDPIGSWDVSNATNMYGMFYGAHGFNQDLSSWDVSNVTTMVSMFKFARSFNQRIGSWDVSKVTNMKWMFHHAISFNQPIGSWNVSKATNMEGMFSYAKSFDQDISSWDISGSGRILLYMFHECAVQTLPSWYVDRFR